MPDIAQVRKGLSERLRDPVTWTEVIQVVKTVVAAVVAWVLAVRVFHLPQPFLAPWAALLVVHATVYRTFARGAQQVAATVGGVLLAWVIGNAFGLSPTALAVMLLLSFALGYLPGLRAEATTVAATALIVLTTGFSDESNILLARLFDTAIGIGVGFVVNLLVWPPLQDLSAVRAVDAIDDEVGRLLQDLADELEDECADEDVRRWVERTQEIDECIDEAWALLRQARESAWYNPRPRSRALTKTDHLGELLERLEQSVSEVRSMVRTLDHSITDLTEWEPEFRRRWIALVRKAGHAIANPDSNEVRAVRTELAELTSDLSTENLSALHWSEYGGLVLNLRNIVTSMDRFAEATPISAPSTKERG